MSPSHRAFAMIGTASLAASVISSLATYPFNLSYFNEAIGGPRIGDQHLLDCNIDWGQDMLRLMEWVDSHPEARPLHARCFGFVPLSCYGIRAASVPAGPASGERNSLSDDWLRDLGPQPGWYAVSVNEIQEREQRYRYFERFEPVALIGYSIRIYHITPDEAQRVRREMALPDLFVATDSSHTTSAGEESTSGGESGSTSMEEGP